jgi:hypothetical protein
MKNLFSIMTAQVAMQASIKAAMENIFDSIKDANQKGLFYIEVTKYTPEQIISYFESLGYTIEMTEDEENYIFHFSEPIAINPCDGCPKKETCPLSEEERIQFRESMEELFKLEIQSSSFEEFMVKAKPILDKIMTHFLSKEDEQKEKRIGLETFSINELMTTLGFRPFKSKQ